MTPRTSDSAATSPGSGPVGATQASFGEVEEGTRPAFESSRSRTCFRPRSRQRRWPKLGGRGLRSSDADAQQSPQSDGDPLPNYLSAGVDPVELHRVEVGGADVSRVGPLPQLSPPRDQLTSRSVLVDAALAYHFRGYVTRK